MFPSEVVIEDGDGGRIGGLGVGILVELVYFLDVLLYVLGAVQLVGGLGVIQMRFSLCE